MFSHISTRSMMLLTFTMIACFDLVAEDPSKGGDSVLRHAVYFKFKDTSSEADVQAVVDAFTALEDSIPSVIGFEQGINNSPEGLDDGFTHCFLVTFADEQGLREYLPHPGHTGLVKLATPHAAGLFVADYFAAPSPASGRELRHAVYFKFKPTATEEQVAEIVTAFESLPSKIEAIRGFEWGRNQNDSPYANGFTHCFLLTFDTEAGRDEYLPHPDHQAFAKQVRPLLDQVRVLDYWTEQ